MNLSEFVQNWEKGKMSKDQVKIALSKIIENVDPCDLFQNMYDSGIIDDIVSEESMDAFGTDGIGIL